MDPDSRLAEGEPAPAQEVPDDCGDRLLSRGMNLPAIEHEPRIPCDVLGPMPRLGRD